MAHFPWDCPVKRVLSRFFRWQSAQPWTNSYQASLPISSNDRLATFLRREVEYNQPWGDKGSQWPLDSINWVIHPMPVWTAKSVHYDSLASPGLGAHWLTVDSPLQALDCPAICRVAITRTSSNQRAVQRLHPIAAQIISCMGSLDGNGLGHEDHPSTETVAWKNRKDSEPLPPCRLVLRCSNRNTGNNAIRLD
jgi:hypothetical protein